MTSIDSIKGLVSKHNGFSHLNRYKVILPSLHIGNDIIAMDAFCRRVTFPGKTLNTFVKRTNQKEINVPSGYTVDNCQMQFTETNDKIVARYIDFWLDTIVNPYDYLVEYRDFYARNIFIMTMNEQDQITYAMILKKAYPKAKLLLDYGDASSNTLAEQPVGFEYEDYEVVDHTLTATVSNVIAAIRGQKLAAPLTNAINLIKKVI